MQVAASCISLMLVSSVCYAQCTLAHPFGTPNNWDRVRLDAFLKDVWQPITERGGSENPDCVPVIDELTHCWRDVR